MEIPSSLFKYCPPKRIDILRNKRIRFTQYCDLNDPFDGIPGLVLPEDMDAYIMEIIKRNMDNEKVKDIIRNGNMENMIRTLGDSYKNSPALMHKANKITMKNFNNHYGILSLSRDGNNELMWAHYADQSRGFMLEIDSTHADFKRDSKSHTVGENELTEVTYSRLRTEINISKFKIPLSCIFTKSLNWLYENEVRIVRQINANGIKSYKHKCTVRNRVGDFDKNIYLFDLDPKIFKRVVLGPGSEEKFRAKLISLIRGNKKLSHIIIEQASIDIAKYGYIYTKIP